MGEVNHHGGLDRGFFRSICGNRIDADSVGSNHLVAAMTQNGDAL
ncbi:hypothetical protein GA0061098_1002255 [Bradyrhizobium shewense]|uniref:Uncharacterized protein n=1 Tax=Bradyrhizobium shewense TaxID=1761772 RepID=A0A1C3UPY4_9BRAD|nr:hypothetical protein GA0061098_1002255 [Bradyrhizobium shewense]